MASSGTVLQMKFGTTAGTKTWSYKYAKPATTREQILALSSAMIANGIIYREQPLRLVSAELVTTTVTTVDVS